MRRSTRLFQTALGLLCVALGAVGIFVPGLPTTCFLLAAAWLFHRGHRGLHRRLTAHPHLGAYLGAARSGAMPLRAEAVSLAGIWGGSALALSRQPVPILSLLLVAAAAIGSVVILRLAPTARA